MLLTLQVHIREGWNDGDIFGGGELHALISFTINTVRHDYSRWMICIDGDVGFGGKGLSAVWRSRRATPRIILMQPRFCGGNVLIGRRILGASKFRDDNKQGKTSPIPPYTQPAIFNKNPQSCIKKK
jgi:hypothetical protein